MRATTGHSDDPITSDAIEEVLQQIESDLGDDVPRAGILFCSVDYELETVLGAVQARWPDLPVIGSTSDGEMSSRLGFCDDSVLLTVFTGDDLKVYTGLGENLSADIGAAVDQALDGCTLERPNLCLTTLAPSTDTAEVVRALSSRLGGARCPILGGLSGDHREFSMMREVHGARAVADSIPVLLIEGSVEVSWGAASGWIGCGEEMTVTRSAGNVVYAIDDRPPLAVFERHYGQLPPTFLGEFPLEVRAPDGSTQLRACLSHCGEDGSMSFGGSVPEGSKVRFTEILKEGLFKGSEDSLAQALDAFPGDDPQLAMIFSCAARKWVLGTEAEREIDVLRAVAEDRGAIDMAFAGLYCFGEIAPDASGETNAFHNETCVSIVLGR